MEIRYTKAAIEELKSFPAADSERIIRKMSFYAEQTNTLSFAKRLTGYPLYRFRVGDYRIICDARGIILFVLAIAKRDDAYRDL